MKYLISAILLFFSVVSYCEEPRGPMFDRRGNLNKQILEANLQDLFYRKMAIPVYDTDNNGVVDNAENTDTVDGYHQNQNVLTTSTPTFGGCLITGNVGIGTTNPLYPIDVSGKGVLSNNLMLGTTYHRNADGYPDTFRYLTVYAEQGSADRAAKLELVGTGGGFPNYWAGGIDFYANNDRVARIECTTDSSAIKGKIVFVMPDGSITINDDAETTFTNNITVNGYTKLGSDAPGIKCIKLSTTTANVEGGQTFKAHGLTVAKITSWTVYVQNSATNFIPPNYLFASEYEYYTEISAGNIYVDLSATNSGNILNKPVTIFIWYEE